MGGRVHACAKREMHAEFKSERLQERHLGDLRTSRTKILKLIKEICVCVCTGCYWLQAGPMGYPWEHSHEHFLDLTICFSVTLLRGVIFLFYHHLLLLVQLLMRVRERSGHLASIRVSSTSALSQQSTPLNRITVTLHTHTHTHTHIIITVPSHPPALNCHLQQQRLTNLFRLNATHQCRRSCLKSTAYQPSVSCISYTKN
jgi:hypothetical protein